jgi:hypothetical protein
LKAKEINVDIKICISESFFSPPTLRGSFIKILLRKHVAWLIKVSNKFLVLNRVQSFTTHSSCFGITVIRAATCLCCLSIPAIIINRELPDLGDDMVAQLLELVNKPVPGALAHSFWCFSTVRIFNFSFNILQGQPRGIFLSKLQSITILLDMQSAVFRDKSTVYHSGQRNFVWFFSFHRKTNCN